MLSVMRVKCAMRGGRWDGVSKFNKRGSTRP